MTVDEKRMALEEMCRTRGSCDSTFDNCICPLCDADADDCDFDFMDGEQVHECYAKAFPEPIEEPTEQVNDIVNHPSHYTHGGMECIDEMITLFGKQVVMHFCLCNAWKYRKRCMYKNGEEDMKKSDWYIAKYKELADG